MITLSENSFSQQAQQLFVQLFRDATPFINAFRHKTFIIYFSDTLFTGSQLHSFVRDLTLLHSLGIKLVLVHSTRNIINQKLDEAKISYKINDELRITTKEQLAIIKNIYGDIRFELENLFIKSINNNLQASEKKEVNNLNIVSGNFVTAQPLGILDGINYQHTGKVRKINAEKIQSLLNDENIVLLSPLASSPSGEIFNLEAADLATECAIKIQADKLIFITQNKGLYKKGQIIQEITSLELKHNYLPEQAESLSVAEVNQLKRIIYAADNGINKIQLLDYQHDGGLLLEIFTNQGIGTLISRDNLEEICQAQEEDINGIKQLIKPLEESGNILTRTIEQLSNDIDNFYVIKRESQVIACAALYQFQHSQTVQSKEAELACLAVNQSYQHSGRASKLFNFICNEARQRQISLIYVLTTQTSHWFKERGFIKGKFEDLPKEKQHSINKNRKSEVYFYKT
ncbi:MAG: amino-acid N-acetyltransferase [Gammaproteobacteria bacterium]|nr:amino-acid N-acetyltransferase [Gammaproteobacteria bacterium]